MVRTIGMLGGMSWESTIEYYRIANELVRERLGGFHSAPILLDSVDFAEIEALQASGEWARAGEILAEHARALEKTGAEVLILCTNTMHKVIDAVDDAVSIPVLHIADATGAVIRKRGLSQVGLLGTRFTMEQDFYRNRLETYGIQVAVPTASDQEIIHRTALKESFWAAPRSNCLFLMLTVRCLSFRQPVFMWRPPSRQRYRSGSGTEGAATRA